ncbi:MAG TPA: hypothetical protein VIH99_06245 [Bdellovibrionota bacterium]|jgi:hypothetical protein
MKTILMIASLFPLVALADIRGTYEVPVKKAELRPYATFEAQVKLVSIEGSKMRMMYLLPDELGGRTVPLVELDGKMRPGGDYVVEDRASGHAGICRAEKAGLSCDIYYGEILLDLRGAEQLLHDKYRDSPKMLEGKLAVLASFGGDPHGIVRAPLQKE